VKILQVSTYDISGGAARATCRLKMGLRATGHDCRMLVRHKHTEDLHTYAISSTPAGEDNLREFFLNGVIQDHFIPAHRTEKSNTMFSLPYPGSDIAQMPALNEADVINLHWVAQYQSPVTLRKLCSLGKPVVWTLHDQWAFTGGCHYTAGCQKYQTNCAQCPQLDNELSSIPSAVLKDKLDLFSGLALTFVTPSQWMADCLQKSRVFRDRRIEVIPNSLETDVFSPSSKEKAKLTLGLEKDTLTFLFGGEDANERRKGFLELVTAVKYLRKKSEFKALLETKKVTMLCFGRPSDELVSTEIPVVSLGYLGSDSEIRDAYCAADVFILPSLEDNLPNTVLEAMSCGTPVVAFEIGGVPDMVDDGITGQLVPLGDTSQMGDAILSLLLDSNRRKLMGEKCREKIQLEYPLIVQAQRYSALYEDLLLENNPGANAGLLKNDEPWEGFSSENPLSSVSLDPSLGPHFKAIYNKILFDALKEAAFQINRKWQTAESDRIARFQVIKDQGETIVALEAEVDRWLNESRRLQDSTVDLTSRQRDLEASSRQRENDYMTERKLLEEHIVDIEADRVARLQVINDQGERIGELEAEVDRWLNESRRLQDSTVDLASRQRALERSLREVKKNTPQRSLEKISRIPGVMRANLSILRDIKDKRLDYFMTFKKILRGGPEENDDPLTLSGNRQEIRSRVTLASLKKRIDAHNASQSNRELLDGIRLFNHNMVDQFNDIFPLRGCTFLDIGASPHGYALERALTRGVAFYAGVGLDVNKNEYITGDSGNAGILLRMDATDLKFPDAMFDAVFSVSVFEHVSRVSTALAEIRRVLRVGGCALISFEPIWSCSYGHHLHHFGECSGLIPPWGHLIWSPDQMRDYLFRKWPSNAPLSLDEAIDWVYYGDSINRLNLRQFKELFDHCGLEVNWRIDLKDDEKKFDPPMLKKGCEATGLDPHELMTKGLCVLLTKEPPTGVVK